MVRGITAGAFDLCHSGHLIFFEKCKLHCDKLIVCLHTDPSIDRPEKNIPIETTFERWVRLKSCKWVDEIIPYDTEEDWLNILSTVNWHHRFLDDSYEGKKYTGCLIEPSKHVFIERSHNYSSTNLRERIHG